MGPIGPIGPMGPIEVVYFFILAAAAAAFLDGRSCSGLSATRADTLAACPVSPSLVAIEITSSAISRRPARVKFIMLVRRRKSFTLSPLAKRAVPPVGRTCDGPAA